MKNQNNSLEKNNIFSKIKSWWYNIFHKTKKVEEETKVVQDTIANENNKNKERNIFDEYRKKNERHKYLLQLQNRYENKMILESDISEKDKTDLEALYIEQIGDLKRKIKSVDTKIQKLGNA